MAGGREQAKPISLFYSYSHEDEELRRKLQKHLAVLRRAGLISEWHDRDIAAGTEWQDAIDRNLLSADIVLMLISSSFIDSDYCWGEEMTKALARHERGEARVVPVILRPCRWGMTPLKKLQATPKDALPVTSWADQDAAFDDVVSKIAAVVAELRRQEAERDRQRADEEAKRKAEEERRQREAGAKRTAEQEARELLAQDKMRSAKPIRPHTAVLPSAQSDGHALNDFTIFRDIDAPLCPEMVVLPAGEFLMGSPGDEEGSSIRERPQHRVTIDYRLAIGRYPVTFEEYDHFCDVVKREKPKDEGWGRGRRPVINVSWEDAKAYCAWLAKETNQSYRLPSEAEWEYACRAQTTTRYAFGDKIGEQDANFGGNVGMTTEVGAYPANPWGLHDMHGNVWEWVEDVWHDNYKGAPNYGSAWLIAAGKKSDRVLRGGSWDVDPGYLRSADRFGDQPEDRYNVIGFRLSRTLTP